LAFPLLTQLNLIKNLTKHVQHVHPCNYRIGRSQDLSMGCFLKVLYHDDDVRGRTDMLVKELNKDKPG
jgi:hypothetical protein